MRKLTVLQKKCLETIRDGKSIRGIQRRIIKRMIELNHLTPALDLTTTGKALAGPAPKPLNHGNGFALENDVIGAVRAMYINGNRNLGPQFRAYWGSEAVDNALEIVKKQYKNARAV